MAATGWLVGAIEINVSINSLVTVVTAFAQHLTPYSSTVLPARGREGQGNKAESRRRENAFSLPWLNTAQHPSGPEPVLGPAEQAGVVFWERWPSCLGPFSACFTTMASVSVDRPQAWPHLSSPL